MRVILIGPDLEENLSLAYLQGALLNAGQECAILAFNRRADLPRVARSVLRSRPGLIGYSLVAQRRYADFQALTTRLRAGGFRGHITAGGHFASLRAEEILRDTSGLDSILHHDGEVRLTALAGWLDRLVDVERPSPNAPTPSPRDLDLSSVPADVLDGITWRGMNGRIEHRPPVRVETIDSLPLPKRRRPDRILGTARAPLVSSRGCHGSCSFCSIHAWHRQVPSGRLRFRSPAHVAEEMVSLHREQGVRLFIFHDDDFIHPDPGKALDRCRRILSAARRGIGRRFAFVIKCRPDEIDEDLFRYLKSEGLVRAYVGIETSSALGTRALNRRVKPGANEAALGLLRRIGVYSCFNLLIFHPETTLDELAENLDFLSRHLSHPFDVARTELYARSALENRMLREGRALGDYRGYDYRIADPRAETVFRLFNELLFERHFGGQSILHQIQDLGLRMSLLQRLYPETASPELLEKVTALIEEINRDSVRYLRRLCRVVAGVSSGVQPAAVEADDPALAGMREEIRSRLRSQRIRLAALSLEIELRARLGWAGLSTSRLLAPAPRLLGKAVSALPGVALILGSLTCTKTQVCDPVPPPVRFSRDIEPTLGSACAVEGCHAAPNPAAGMDLSVGASYDQLVNVPSTELPSMFRVKPGDTGQSYLVHKLRGTQDSVGGSGEQMPKGGTPDPSFTADVEEWVRDGAARD